MTRGARSGVLAAAYQVTWSFDSDGAPVTGKAVGDSLGTSALSAIFQSSWSPVNTDCLAHLRFLYRIMHISNISLFIVCLSGIMRSFIKSI
jgi:hypothetical protein